MWFAINENKEVIGISKVIYKNWIKVENYPENVIKKLGIEKLIYNIEINSII